MLIALDSPLCGASALAAHYMAPSAQLIGHSASKTPVHTMLRAVTYDLLSESQKFLVGTYEFTLPLIQKLFERQSGKL